MDGMMENFYEKQWSTFEEFRNDFNEYCKETSQVFCISDSRTVQKRNEKLSLGTQPFNQCLKYAYVRYACVHFGTKFNRASRPANSRRSVRSSLKKQCPVQFMLSAKKTASEQVLYISSRITEHNHLLEAELYTTYSNACQSNNLQCAQPQQLVKDEEQDDYDDDDDVASDLNMVCTNIQEIDPSSVIEMLLDNDEETACEVYDDTDSASLQPDNDAFLADVAEVDEITETQLKQELEDLTSTNSMNMVTPVFNQSAAEEWANSLHQDGAEVQVCEVSGLNKQPVKKRLACDICGQLYERPKMLEKHRRKHDSEYNVASGIRQSQVNTAGSESLSKPATASTENIVTNRDEKYHGPCDTGIDRYVCGECGVNFDEASKVTSHMFSKHMCLCKQQGQTGEVYVLRILKSGITQLPNTAENSANSPMCDEDDGDDDGNVEQTGLKSDVENLKSLPDSTSCSSFENKRCFSDAENDKSRPVGDVVDRGSNSQRLPKLCTICGKMFRNLEVHVRLHRRPDYECPDCGRKFVRSDYLKEHRRVHSNERPFLCMECGLSFKAPSHLRDHLKSHADVRRYRCDQCGKWFRRASHRSEHIRNVHEGVKAFQCKQCPRAFSTANGLKLHVMGHTNERPHACPMCPKQFKRSAKLEQHMVTHTGERPFPCRFCERRFTQTSAVKMHEATQHTADGGRRHQCELCGQRFNKRSIRDAHVRRHKGEKPYACALCSWTFAYAGDLRNHMVVKHKVKRNATAGRPQSSLTSAVEAWVQA